MPKFIDVDKAKTMLAGDYPIQKVIRIVLDALPVADVVEVVRCKDCVNRIEFDTNKYHCVLTECYCGETGYCSYGVRKENNGGE